jgi:DNA-directed RNA polymerase subunit M/transcription elongation factor TFIIS
MLNTTHNMMNTPYVQQLKFIPMPIICHTAAYNALRRSKLRMFSECLNETAQYFNAPYMRQFEIIDRLERSCLNEAIILCKAASVDATWSNDRFVDAYHALCAKVAANIDASSSVNNVKLINDILSDQVVIENIPAMSSVELFPDKYSEIHARIEQSANATFSVTESKRYKCPKCRVNSCTILSVQTRSLDEPATLRASCIACGFNWHV